MPPLPRWLPPATCGLIVGLLLGGPVLRARQAVPPGAAAVNPQENRVLADLYMKSAEYRACCLQVYRCGLRRLDEILKATHPPRPAVVMDLDETVLDNSAFQTFLYRHGLDYSDALWAEAREAFSEEAMLQLILLAGHYRTNAYVSAGLQVPVDPRVKRPFPTE